MIFFFLAHFLEWLPEASQFYRWLLSISGCTRKQSALHQKGKGGERGGDGGVGGVVHLVWGTMCPQGSSITQSDNLSAPSQSLTNNRTRRYKLPSNSGRMARRRLENVDDTAENSSGQVKRMFRWQYMMVKRTQSPRGRRWNAASC